MKDLRRFSRPTLLTLLLVLAFPACSSLRETDEDFTRNQYDFIEVERQIHDAINDYRTYQGLPPLTIHTTLTSVARSHSSAMATGREPFSHNNAKARFNRIRSEFDAGRISENVAYSTSQPNLAGAIVDGWIRSSDHRKAILGPFSSTGIAVSKSRDGRYYVTQIFVAEKEQTLM